MYAKSAKKKKKLRSQIFANQFCFTNSNPEENTNLGQILENMTTFQRGVLNDQVLLRI